MGKRFDVFFSYNAVDHVAVTRIARALHKRGIRVFLDRWYLQGGLPWPKELEKALAGCGSVAVFIGPAGLGPWQQRERDLALDRQGRESGFAVIPVLLANVDPGLGFLRLNTWVNLTQGPDDAEALAMLIAAIRGEPPGPMGLQASSAARAAVCPYRGLRPFREEDEPFFFGRAIFAETLGATMLRQSFVAVVGASGSGKSSVVRAGLLPRLRRGAGGLVWDALTLVPTDQPLRSLAAALLPLLEPDLSEVDRLAEVGKLAGHFAADTVPLREVAQRVLAKQPGTDRLLLFVDQWEELYTLCGDEGVCGSFIEMLLQATAGGRVQVVLTLRGDFMGHALANRALSDRLQDAVVTVGPMTPDELAETINRPAEKAGLQFEAGLAEMILDDVGKEPGALPLLEFLLEGLWAKRRGTLLTHDAYVGLGRVSGAIARRAEAVFEQGLNKAEREAAQRLLVRMVRPGEGVEDTRRRTVLPAADVVAEATIRKLAAERLVVTERDAGSGALTVEVAHEALIQHWQRLRTWIDADRDFLRTRERIAAQAAPWEAEGRPDDRLLPPGRPLEEGKELLATRKSDLEPELVGYIEASVAAEKQKLAAARAKDEAERVAERRRTRTARAMATVMLLFVIVAVGFAYKWQAERATAWQYLERAERSGSRALVALATVEADNGSPATALRLALAGRPNSLAAQSQSYFVERLKVVSRTLDKLHEVRRFNHSNKVTYVGFSTNRLLATDSDYTVRLWEVASGKEIATIGHKGSCVAFSPDGRLFATACSFETVRLYEVASGKAIAEFRGDEGWVGSVAFSPPDGRLLATGDGLLPGFQFRPTSRLWEVENRKDIKDIAVGVDVNAVAFSPPDGRLLATGSTDGTVRLWEVASGKEIGVRLDHNAAVLSIAFSADGHLLATGCQDNTAQLWEVASGKQVAALRGHERGVTSVAFSPDGRLLATGSDDTTARLWEVASGEQVAVLRGHENEVTSVAFSPNGRLLATGSDDTTARLWEVASARVGWAEGQVLVEFACARVHELPLIERDRQRFGVEKEWCTPEASAALRAKFGLDKPLTATVSTP